MSANVLPLRWQGASRVERMRALVAERIDAWIAQWAAPGVVQTAIVVESLGGQRPEISAPDIRWYALRDAGGTLTLRIAGAGFEHLGCKLVGIVASDDAGMAAGIGQRALTDLARAFFAASAPASLTAVQSMPAAEEIGLRYGATGLQIAIGTIRIELHFDAALCSALLPAAMPPAMPLTALREAVRPIDATFDAVLDLGQTALSDSMSLRPGEVLKTSIPIGAGIRIKTGDGADILSGTLVVEDGHRALKVVKTYFPQGSNP
jgi:hypothetical protein